MKKMTTQWVEELEPFGLEGTVEKAIEVLDGLLTKYAGRGQLMISGTCELEVTLERPETDAEEEARRIKEAMQLAEASVRQANNEAFKKVAIQRAIDVLQAQLKGD